MLVARFRSLLLLSIRNRGRVWNATLRTDSPIMIRPSRFLYFAVLTSLVTVLGLTLVYRHYAVETLLQNRTAIDQLGIQLTPRPSVTDRSQSVAEPAWKPLQQQLRQTSTQLGITSAVLYDDSSKLLFSLGRPQSQNLSLRYPQKDTDADPAYLLSPDLFSLLGLANSEGALIVTRTPWTTATGLHATLRTESDASSQLNAITRVQWQIAMLSAVAMTILCLYMYRVLHRKQKQITTHQQEDSRARHKAGHDALTGLPNRSLLNDRLEQAVDHARRHQRTLVLMFLDLDGFKPVNDTLGHKAGDKLLQQISRRLSQCVREGDTVARLGGDEFVLVLPLFDSRYSEQISEVADRVLSSVSTPIILKGKEIRLGCSIGISRFPADGADAETLLQHADAAMYRAKALGRNNYKFFSQQQNSTFSSGGRSDINLLQALERDEFCLLYRPRLDLSSGCVSGLIVELHWKRPGFGLVPAEQLINAGNSRDDLCQIGHWILESTCLQARLWQQKKLSCGPITLRISMNLFRVADLHSAVTQTLNQSRLDPDLLDLDLTGCLSSLAAEQLDALIVELKRAGVRISIDGMVPELISTARMAVDQYRIGADCVEQLCKEPAETAAAEILISLGRKLSRPVTAEGITSAAQLKWLKRRACSSAEGSWISAPLSATELQEFVHARRQKRTPGSTTPSDISECV